MAAKVSRASIHSRCQASQTGENSKPSQVKPSRTRIASSALLAPNGGSITT